MSAGRMYVRPCGKGHELVAMHTPAQLHAISTRADALAVKVAEQRQSAIWHPSLHRFDTLTARLRKLRDIAWDCALSANRALGNSIAQEFNVECQGCGDTLDVEATELIGDDRYCRQCAAEQKREAADALCSDWFDYNHDRGL